MKYVFLTIALVSVLFPISGANLDEISFGSVTSESVHALLSNSTNSVTGALSQTCRKCLPLATQGINGGDLTFTMKVDPIKRNYVTVKFWGGDESANTNQLGRLYLYIPQNGVNYSIGGRHESDYTALALDGGADPLPGRFFYSTTLLPLNFTRGKTSLTLRIVSTGRLYGLGSGVAPSGNYQFLMTSISRGIYKAFTHTEPMLDVSGEIKGTPPATGTVSFLDESYIRSGGTYFNKVQSRITNRMAVTIDIANFNGSDALFLAKCFHLKDFTSYHNPSVVRKVVAMIDALANAYYANNHSAEGWGGAYGAVGEAIYYLKSELHNWLDVSLPYTKGVMKRRDAWGDLLVASRDWGRYNRRTITNQVCWAEMSVFTANLGLLSMGDSRALSNVESQRYPKEALGMLPFLGSDLTTGGSAKNFGSNYYQVTTKGLTREYGYVGADYGEMSPFAAKMYKLTGNEEFRKQAIKMIKARINFRRPALELSGTTYYLTMEAIGLLAWRGVNECDGTFADQLAYGDRLADFGGMFCAAATMDPDLLAYARQLLDDKQLFQALQWWDPADPEQLDIFTDYYRVKNATTTSSAKIPMTNGQPDFAWADEENAIVALKHGDERLWISSYWQANGGINSLARFHYSTPNYDQIGLLETTPTYRNKGSYVVRGTAVDNFVQGSLPDQPVHAYAGELLPVAVSELMDDNTIRGKADFYSFRFGKYLFGINMSATRFGNLYLPKEENNVTDLLSGSPFAADSILSVEPRTSKILYLNHTIDTMAVPRPPVLLYFSYLYLPTVRLNWTHASGAVTYRVKRSNTAGGPYEVIATALTDTLFTDANSKAGCYYIVTALNDKGESCPSSEISSSSYVTSKPIITTPKTATAQVGSKFQYTIGALFAPTSFAAIGLPVGLSLNSTSIAGGIISGTPVAAGEYDITLKVGNAGGTTAETLRLTILPAEIPQITNDTLLTAYAGIPFSLKLLSTNNPTSFSVSGFPTGFVVDSAKGFLNGTFSTVGSDTLTVRATNSAGADTCDIVVKVVNPPVPEITSDLSYVLLTGKDFKYSIVALFSPTSFGATGLPAGLTLDPQTGVISGIPTTAGSYSVALSATNGSGTSAKVNLVLTVQQSVPSPWVDEDITSAGTAITTGYTAYKASPESFTVNGAGWDVGSKNDGFHFMNQSITGDGTLIGRISAWSKVSGPKMGLMMRETNDTGSKCVFLEYEYSLNKVRFPVRSSSWGGMTYSLVSSTIVGSYLWLKLVRSGSNFTGSISADGTTWTTLGTVSASMNNSILAGVGVCSRSSTLASVTVDNLSFNKPTAMESLASERTNVYPNPVSSMLYIDFPSILAENLICNVYNMLGTKLSEHILNGFSNEVDLSKLPKGLYLVEIRTPTTRILKKIQKI